MENFENGSYAQVTDALTQAKEAFDAATPGTEGFN